MDVEDPARPAADALTAAEVEKMKVATSSSRSKPGPVDGGAEAVCRRARLLAALG